MMAARLRDQSVKCCEPHYDHNSYLEFILKNRMR